ncbi:MAG: hypothetical protein WAU70_02665 [Flavobacteriales bacterium]
MNETGPAIGAFIFSAPLWLISMGSLLLIFLDYHKRSNIHKALLFILAVVSGVAGFVLLPGKLKLIVALCSPLVLFLAVMLGRRKKR